jgi:tetratricopeptide (TPR) repeat protein
MLVLGVLAAACGPSDPVEAARQLQAEGRFEESLAPLGELVQARRDDPEVHYLHGLALSRTGRPSQAVWSLRRAMESPEWKVAAGLQLGASALRTGNYDEAVEVLTGVLEEEPDDSAALLLRAMARIQTRRDYEGALADADRLLEIEPENQQILPHRAVALLGLERTEEAAEALAQLERSATDGVIPGPSAGGYCGARAKFAEESRELEKAERLYRSCLEQFPANGLLLREAVEFFDATGKSEAATAALRDAHEATPHSRDLRVTLAVRLERLGDEGAAEALLRDATSEAQPILAASAYADLGGFLADRGRLAEAIASYERALELAPEARERLLFPYADKLVMAGEHDRALELAEEISIPAQRHLIRGRALQASGELEAALSELSSGLTLWPDQPIGRYYAGLTAEQLGDFDRAIEEYRYAVRASSLLDARLRLARLHQALGEPRPALVALRHDPQGSGLGVEAALLELELLATLSPTVQLLRPSLNDPSLRARVVAALAAGTRRRAGHAAAAQVVLAAKQLDLADPDSAPALAGLLEDLLAAGRAEHAVKLLERMRERAPESAEILALHAEALEGAGNASEAGAGYARALELDPELSRALRGQARLAAAAGEPQAALRAYEKGAAAAAERGLDDAGATLAIAELLVAEGRRAEGMRRLDDWLTSHPLDAEVALLLATLLADSEGGGGDRARELGQRAIRLRAGPEAIALAERLGAAAVSE